MKPDQVTLVPDIDALTANAGWDIILIDFLRLSLNLKTNIRTSIFIDTNHQFTKVQRCWAIELNYIQNHMLTKNNLNEIKKYIDASSYANSIGLGVNAGHDLNLENINFSLRKYHF